MKRILTFSLMMVISVAAFSQTGKWKKADKTSTIESYHKFLTDYPDSKYKDLARLKLDALYEERDWKLAIETNKLENYEEYLRLHDYSKHSDEAKSKIELLIWQETERTNKYDAYNKYLSLYPNGKMAKVAEKKLTELQGEKAKYFLNVLSIVFSEEEQTFLTGYTLGANKLNPSYESGKPLSGSVFVIVKWDLGDFRVRGDGFRLNQSELVLIEDGEEAQVGYIRGLTSNQTDKTIWQSGSGYTITYPAGTTPGGRNLFIVKKGNINSLRIWFLGKDYPLIVSEK